MIKTTAKASNPGQHIGDDKVFKMTSLVDL
jgi:hypothetical protein